MKKLTLQFSSLAELLAFSKQLNGGYLLNTVNLTITGVIPEMDVTSASEQYHAKLVETTDKVFSYQLLR